MFTKFVNKKVQETLNVKERVLSRNDLKTLSFPNNLSAAAYSKIEHMGSRTPFFRMISNKAAPTRNVVIWGGDRTQEGEQKAVFNLI